MSYQLSELEIEEITAKLPPEFAALKDLYPVAIARAAEYYNEPPFPKNYQAECIEFYFDERARGPGIIISSRGIKANFEYYKPNSPVLIQAIDDECAYIRVGSLVLLDRRGGTSLPPLPDAIELEGEFN